MRSETLRGALGRFCTGVTVITADDGDGGARGMTANAFMSGSLDPPLIVVSVHVRARLHATIEAAGAFGVSILPEFLEYEARRFAGLPVDVREDPPEFSWCDGVPVLAGALGWLTAAVAQRHAVGDHTLFVGVVANCGYSAADGAPLGYFRSAFARVVTAETADAIAIDPWDAGAADRWG